MPEENNLERAIGKLEGKMDMLVASMDGMAQAFNNLEKGRLSTLEINFAKLLTETNERTSIGISKAKGVAMWTTLIASGVISVIVALVLKYWFK